MRPQGWDRPSSHPSQHLSPTFDINEGKVDQTESPDGWCFDGCSNLDVLMLVIPQGEHGTRTCIRNVDVFFAVLHENEIRAAALCNPRRPAQSMRRNVQAKETCDWAKNFCPLAAAMQGGKQRLPCRKRLYCLARRTHFEYWQPRLRDVLPRRTSWQFWSKAKCLAFKQRKTHPTLKFIWLTPKFAVIAHHCEACSLFFVREEDNNNFVFIYLPWILVWKSNFLSPKFHTKDREHSAEGVPTKNKS